MIFPSDVVDIDPEKMARYGERAGKVIERYRELYREHQRAPYLVTGRAEKRDLDAACRLCEVFSDEEIEKLLVFWLQIPNGVDSFITARNTRTLTMCLSKASAIARRLGLTGGAQ